jgi:hypothetical protein
LQTRVANGNFNALKQLVRLRASTGANININKAKSDYARAYYSKGGNSRHYNPLNRVPEAFKNNEWKYYLYVLKNPPIFFFANSTKGPLFTFNRTGRRVPVTRNNYTKPMRNLGIQMSNNRIPNFLGGTMRNLETFKRRPTKRGTAETHRRRINAMLSKHKPL